MPNLTSDQALKVAQTFADFATSVQTYRFAHIADLSELQEANLRNIENSLLTTSNNFIDLGINLVLDNAQAALDGLGQVTVLVKKDLKKLDDINKALKVITVLVQLSTAFATGNPMGIASAIGSAIDTLSSQGQSAGGGGS